MRLYNLVEVAEIMGVRRRTVRYWVATGRLPAIKIKYTQGYPWLVRADDLEKFMEDRKYGGKR